MERFAAIGMAAALGATAIIASSVGAGAAGSRAGGILRDVGGTRLGVARLTATGDGKVLVQVSVSGLTSGFHGFHIHTIGSCDATGVFVSAGVHFSPTAAVHGSHAGDQPVILVNADGTGMGRFLTDRYAVADLFDGDGSAFIVHAGADNYANIPTRYTPDGGGTFGPDATTLGTGDAGARTLCGVIRST